MRSFRHVRVDISKPKKNLILVEKWFGTKKENAIVRTICSHINNMIKGVTKASLQNTPSTLCSEYTNIHFKLKETVSVGRISRER